VLLAVSVFILSAAALLSILCLRLLSLNILGAEFDIPSVLCLAFGAI